MCNKNINKKLDIEKNVVIINPILNGILIIMKEGIL